MVSQVNEMNTRLHKVLNGKFRRGLAGALRVDLFRGISSPFLFLSIIAITVVQLSGVFNEIQLTGETNVLYLYRRHKLDLISLFLAAMPYSTAYCTEYRSRFARYSIQRSSAFDYAWAKMISSSLLGCLATFLGVSLFLFTLALRFPLMDKTDSMYEVFSDIGPYGSLLKGSHPGLYFLFMAANRSLMASVLAAIATASSAFIPNLFVVLSSPIISYYFVMHALPMGLWNPYDVYRAINIGVGGPLTSMLYAIFFAMAWIYLLGWIFYWGVKRRIENG